MLFKLQFCAIQVYLSRQCHLMLQQYEMDYSACIFIILGHIDMPIFRHDTNFIRGHPVHLGEHLASAISFDLCRQLILIT